MTFDIHLYITDHKDTLPDLHTMEHADDVRSWFSKVDDVCVHHDHFKNIDDELLKEAKNHTIVQGFAVVFYPPGEMLDADSEVGEQFKNLFKNHRIKFSWNLTPNPNLDPRFYDVYLELIVKKSEDEGGEDGDSKSEETKAEEKLSIAEREKMLLGELHPETVMEEPQPRDNRSLEDKILDRVG